MSHDLFYRCWLYAIKAYSVTVYTRYSMLLALFDYGLQHRVSYSKTLSEIEHPGNYEFRFSGNYKRGRTPKA